MARGYAECTGEPEARLDIQHIRCCAMCAARTSATAGTARHCAKCAAHFAKERSDFAKRTCIAEVGWSGGGIIALCATAVA